MAKRETISDRIRRAIEESGESAGALAESTMVHQPTITRFLHGRDLRGSTLDKLAEYFDLVLVEAPNAKTKRTAKQATKSKQTASKQRTTTAKTKRKRPTRSSRQAKTPPRGPQSRAL